MTSIVNRSPALRAPAETAKTGARWSDMLLHVAGSLQQTFDELGRHRAAAELRRTAIQYETTQPGFAADLRQAAGVLNERG